MSRVSITSLSPTHIVFHFNIIPKISPLLRHLLWKSKRIVCYFIIRSTKCKKWKLRGTTAAWCVCKEAKDRSLSIGYCNACWGRCACTVLVATLTHNQPAKLLEFLELNQLKQQLTQDFSIFQMLQTPIHDHSYMRGIYIYMYSIFFLCKDQNFVVKNYYYTQRSKDYLEMFSFKGLVHSKI